MGKYSCEKCAKSFSQKSHYDKHISRKNPCEIQTDKIKALIDKAIDERFIELNKKLILHLFTFQTPIFIWLNLYKNHL